METHMSRTCFCSHLVVYALCPTQPTLKRFTNTVRKIQLRRCVDQNLPQTLTHNPCLSDQILTIKSLDARCMWELFCCTCQWKVLYVKRSFSLWNLGCAICEWVITVLTVVSVGELPGWLAGVALARLGGNVVVGFCDVLLRWRCRWLAVVIVVSGDCRSVRSCAH